MTDAAIKLHGQSSWLLTVMFDQNPKMQFDISFNQTNPSGKFHGVSKLVFDMPREDLTYMHDRLAHHWMRQVGLMAGCSTNARLNINNNYYGLYVLEENVNSHLVDEFYPNNPNGDLWKGGEIPETNQSNPNWDRLAAFKAAKDFASISQIVDIPNSLTSWAAEALLYDGDGYYGGFHNFYLYDQGTAGMVFLPQDTDSTFDWLVQFDLVGATDHPIYWWYKRAQPAPTPGDKWLPVLNDMPSRMQYADAIAALLAKWDVKQIQGWIDSWWSDIQSSALGDPHQWTTPGHHQRVARDREERGRGPRGVPADLRRLRARRAGSVHGRRRRRVQVVRRVRRQQPERAPGRRRSVRQHAGRQLRRLR